MNEIKIQRYQAQIADIINRVIVTKVNDKSAKFGRVTYVKLAKDLQEAKVYVECLDHQKINQTIQSLNKISGLFRSEIAHVINTYKTPKIIFLEDKTINYAKNIDKILENLNKEKE